MPRPVDPGAAYLPGLDGIRALAVGLVIAYHLGVPGASGGLLGVGVFFTLSGFLITTILIRSWDKRGSLDLGTFWIRRARRLLPAVILLLLAVLATVAIVDVKSLGKRAIEAWWALVYVANWATIVKGESYFDRFQAPSPFSHLWSLSVEEQFYVLWPIALLVLLVIASAMFGRSAYGRQRALRLVAIITLILGAVSFLLLAFLAAPGVDNTRAYEGTDTRAGGLLWGAALAMAWRPEHWSYALSAGKRAIVDGLSLVGLTAILYLVATTNEQSLSIYRVGILALTIATCLVIVGATSPDTLFSRLFSLAPLRWLGERTYGIYLWHMPIVVFTPRLFTAEHPVLTALGQVAFTVGIASLSWTFFEDPIRRHGFLGALSRKGSVGDVAARLGVGSTFTLATGLVFATAVSGMVLATRLPVPTAEELAARQAGSSVPPSPPSPSAPEASSPTTASASASATTPPPKPAAPAKLTTSCERVVHIGDSTSVGLASPDYLPEPDQRIGAQYKSVGAKEVREDIDGARAIEEHYQGHPSGFDATKEIASSGFNGCWVIALGLNDAATIGNGGTPVTAKMRIDAVMGQIKPDQQVVWVSSVSMPWAEPTYADARMQKWNAALQEALGRYGNLRVYDWAADVARWSPKEKAQYFQDDGVHYSTPGCRIRARAIAKGLALALPQGGGPSEAKTLTVGTPAQILA